MPASEVLGKFKRGVLRSGGKHGKPVKKRSQAVAIMLSEKRAEAKHGGTYPDRKKKARDKRLVGKKL